MKHITLKRISLRNFKGIRELDMEFGQGVTSVMGRNGSGKTTLFDAFTWVLFGKDSRDREKFQLMTLDANGQEIPRLQHEVSLVLEIDGKETRLTRRKSEKWTKRRGSAIEEKTGTEEERIYNDIPCSVKEWDDKIRAICPYVTFKYITSPTYFATQKAEMQREMLVQMAGDISDAEVASGNAGFGALLEQLGDKTLDEYKREITAKKKRIKAELDEYPVRIKECNSVIDGYADVDFAAIEKEIQEKKKALAEINEGLLAAKRGVAENAERIKGISRELNETMCRKAEIEHIIRRDAMQACEEAKRRQEMLSAERSRLRDSIAIMSRQISDMEQEAARMTKRRNECLAELKQIKADAQGLTYTADDFRCPTCGQMLEAKGIEAKKAEIERRFNESISRRLEANREAGQRCSIRLIEQAEQEANSLRAKAASAEMALATAERSLAKIHIPKAPTDAEVQGLLDNSAEYQDLRKKEQSLYNALNKQGTLREAGTDAEDMAEAREMLIQSLEELNKQIGKRDIIDSRKALIADYEKKMRAKGDELAALEGIEYTISDFAKTKISAVEERINSLFSLVRFKMYDYQLNGGWKETCEATVGGVPYSVLNSAMRINAGLDIINAISKHCGTAAPVFIDNAEGVNSLLPMESQVIRLVVTDDEKLKVR